MHLTQLIWVTVELVSEEPSRAQEAMIKSVRRRVVIRVSGPVRGHSHQSSAMSTVVSLLKSSCYLRRGVLGVEENACVTYHEQWASRQGDGAVMHQ